MLLPRCEKNIIVPTGAAFVFNRTAERNICQTTGIEPMLFDRDKKGLFCLLWRRNPRVGIAVGCDCDGGLLGLLVE